MTLIELIKLAASAGGGALLLHLLTYRVSMRKQNLPEFEAIIEKYRTLISDSEGRLKQIEEKLLELQRENSNLKTSLLMFESSHSDIPLPMWLKNEKGMVLFANKHYEDMFLKPIGKSISDYVGNTDFHVWPRDVALQFRAHDAQVIRNKAPLRVIEEIIVEDGRKLYLDVLKYPRFSEGQTIGVAGIVLDHRFKKEEL